MSYWFRGYYPLLLMSFFNEFPGQFDVVFCAFLIITFSYNVVFFKVLCFSWSPSLFLCFCRFSYNFVYHVMSFISYFLLEVRCFFMIHVVFKRCHFLVLPDTVVSHTMSFLVYCF